MQKVVIIEDNEVVARLYENKLRAAGNVVHVAYDGAEGLNLIHSVKPNLVLLDLMLPSMSGTEIIRNIRSDSRFNKLPIMAYSSADEDVLAEAVNAGSTTIISKNQASFKEILQHFNDLMEANRDSQIYNPADFSEEDQPDESLEPKPGQILVVEDDLITARVITDIIDKAGFAAVVISDGQEAYKLLANNSNFAAVIFDVELPKIRGTDLLKYMRTEKRLRTVPAMVMTASPDYVKLQIESYGAGATFFISKPFERSIFELLINNLTKNK
jgi:CheY-like chemotaxis protein